jgi:catalase
MVGGGPSVLYDAVAIVVSEAGAAELAQQPPAKDFVNDAHAHCKLIAYTPEASALLDAASVTDLMDAGYHLLGGRTSAKDFIAACRDLRWWARVTTEPL